MDPTKADCLHGVKEGVPQAIAYHEEHFAELEYPSFWKAFDDLRTEAPSGMGLNRIPSSAIVAYARRWGMSRTGYEIFDFIIRLLDNHHVAVQSKRQAEQK